MASGSNLISYGRQFVGEGSSRFTKAYGAASSTAWCCIFVWYVCKHFGGKLPFAGKKIAYVPTADSWLASNATWVKQAQAQAGDVVIFTWSGTGNNSGSGSRDHIGFIVSRNSNGTFQTLEGNTSGSKVAVRTRAAKYIYKIYRPNYSGSTSGSTSTSSSTASGKGTLYTVNSSNGLNVRAGAGTSYKIVGGLSNGTAVRITKTSGKWGYSSACGGWLCMDYLKKSGSTSSSASTASGYKVGKTYTLQADMKVRTGAGTNYRQKKRSELTADGKKHALAGTYACLKKGTKVTCQKVSGNWMQIPSGWVCIKDSKKAYIK